LNKIGNPTSSAKNHQIPLPLLDSLRAGLAALGTTGGRGGAAGGGGLNTTSGGGD